MNGDSLSSEVIDLIHNLRSDQLAELLMFIRELQFRQRLEKAEKDFEADRGVNWRLVRSDA